MAQLSPINGLGLKRTVMTKTKIARAALLAGILAMGLTGCKGGLFGGGGDKTTPTVGNRTPILSRIESGAEVDPALAGITVVLPPARANAEWAQVGGAASKSYGHLALAENPAKAWTARVAGSSTRMRLAAAPVVGGNKLFAVGTDGVITAFDKNTGARLWSRGDQRRYWRSAVEGQARRPATRIADDRLWPIVRDDAG